MNTVFNRVTVTILAVTVFLVLFLAACGPRELEPDAAFECDRCEEWNEPFTPFRIYGNTWYVGTDGLSSILVETDEGLILLDGALPQSAPLIAENIRRLGFDPLDIKAIMLSHAHYDHAGGINALQRLSGATVYTSESGAVVLAEGQLQPDDPQFAYGPETTSFPAVRNVRAIADGDSIVIGDVTVTAVYTPGHTPSGTSWTWKSCALGECYDVVYADSLTAVSAPGYHFADGAAQQLIDSADKISRLNCDILLSPHPFFFGLHDKVEKRDEGNPFVNNVGCLLYGETALNWLQQRLDAEK